MLFLAGLHESFFERFSIVVLTSEYSMKFDHLISGSAARARAEVAQFFPAARARAARAQNLRARAVRARDRGSGKKCIFIPTATSVRC